MYVRSLALYPPRNYRNCQAPTRRSSVGWQQAEIILVLIFKARILRVVASIDFVEQTGPYEWLANETTQAMALPPVAAGYRYLSYPDHMTVMF
jgi:hypothetical protein